MSETPLSAPPREVVASNTKTAAYVSDQLAEQLRSLDYEYAFLVPGSTFRGLHDSLVNHLQNRQPAIALATHEMIAMSMAHGYAKATGKPGLCIVHDLVGLMAGSMSIYNAFADCVPMLILGGSGPLDAGKRRWIDWVHCASDQSALIANFTKWTDEPTTPEATFDAVAEAHRMTKAAPSGPVYVSIDCEIQEMDAIPDAPRVATSTRFEPAMSDLAVERVAKLLTEADMPVIIGGRITRQAEAASPLEQLVELSAAAYLDDQACVGLPTDHEQNLSGDWSIVREADLIICLDCRDISSVLAGYSSDKGFEGVSLRDDASVVDISLMDSLHSPWSQMKGASVPVDIRIPAEPLHAASLLVAALERELARSDNGGERTERRRLICSRHEELRSTQRGVLTEAHIDGPITPAQLVHEVHEAVKHLPWRLVHRNQTSFPEGIWSFPGAGSYLGHNGGGGVGYGPGASVGAALGLKGRGLLPVAILGDGDFAMSAGAIWTGVNLRVPLLMIINNNRTWGNDEKHQIDMAKIRQRPVENAWVGQRMEDPVIDHASIARSFGATAYGPIRSIAELATLLPDCVESVMNGSLTVIDVWTQL